MEAIHVADLVPELFEDVPPDVLAQARAAAVAPVTLIPAGPWQIEGSIFSSAAAPGGALVVAGLLLHRVSLVRARALEFVGPGDLLRPWVQMGHEGPFAESQWLVHEPAQLAILDRDFLDNVAPWPEVTTALMDRLVLRARGLACQLAIVTEQRVDRRVLLLLWQLAERWGRSNGEGTWLPVSVTHDLLAAAVGASRPTVSTAVAQLQRTGLVSRKARGTWLLHGERSSALRTLKSGAAPKPGCQSG